MRCDDRCDCGGGIELVSFRRDDGACEFACIKDEGRWRCGGFGGDETAWGVGWGEEDDDGDGVGGFAAEFLTGVVRDRDSRIFYGYTLVHDLLFSFLFLIFFPALLHHPILSPQQTSQLVLASSLVMDAMVAVAVSVHISFSSSLPFFPPPAEKSWGESSLAGFGSILSSVLFTYYCNEVNVK